MKLGIFDEKLFYCSISSIKNSSLHKDLQFFLYMPVPETKYKSDVHESTFRSLEYRLIASRLYDLDSFTRKQTYRRTERAGSPLSKDNRDKSQGRFVS